MKAQQQGFVLAVVLWSIVALTLITGGLIATINGTLEQAYRMREIARQDREFFSTEQTLLYVLAARPRNAAGVDLDPAERAGNDPFVQETVEGERPTLRMDGTSYPGIGHSQYRLRDTGGLFSLHEPGPETWGRVAEALGVSKSEADQWYDQLIDYQDLDSLTRLNGAEQSYYRESGLVGPPNRFLVTPHELRNLPMAEQRPALTEQLIQISTSRAGGSVNPNTSPAPILDAMLGMDGSDRTRLLSQRSTRLFTSAAELSLELGFIVAQDGFGSSWSANRSVRIELLDGQGRQRRWIAVEFTPDTEGRPWVIDYNHPVELPVSQQESYTPDVFQPDRSAETAAPATDWTYYSALFPAELPLAR